MFSDYTGVCNKCQTQFTRSFSDMMKYTMYCPKCQGPKEQQELYDFIKSFGVEVKYDYRELGPEIDLYLPQFKVGIEINGVYWHSESMFGNGTKQSPDRHYKKYLYYKHLSPSIQIVNIDTFDYYKNNSDIIKSYIQNLINKIPHQNRIYARKCIIKEVSQVDANEFYQNNHILGSSKWGVNFGLFYQDDIVGLMSIGRNSKDEYNLNRFCTKNYINVVGGASKLFKHFIKYIKNQNNQNKDIKIVSFSDNNYFNGNIYNKLGFNKESEVGISYFYFNKSCTSKYHKFNFRKNLIKSKIPELYSPEKSEYQMMLQAGYDRVWDTGKIKWVYYLRKS